MFFFLLPTARIGKIAPVDSNIYGQLKRFESRILDLEQQQKKNSCCVHCFRFLVEDILVPFDDNDLVLLKLSVIAASSLLFAFTSTLPCFSFACTTASCSLSALFPFSLQLLEILLFFLSCVKLEYRAIVCFGCVFCTIVMFKFKFTL